jgi:hypothetical protein
MMPVPVRFKLLRLKLLNRRRDSDPSPRAGTSAQTRAEHTASGEARELPLVGWQAGAALSLSATSSGPGARPQVLTGRLAEALDFKLPARLGLGVRGGPTVLHADEACALGAGEQPAEQCVVKSVPGLVRRIPGPAPTPLQVLTLSVHLIVVVPVHRRCLSRAAVATWRRTRSALASTLR